MLNETMSPPACKGAREPEYLSKTLNINVGVANTNQSALEETEYHAQRINESKQDGCKVL